MREPPEQYGDYADNPPWIKAQAEVRRLAPREGCATTVSKQSSWLLIIRRSGARQRRNSSLNKPYGIGSRTKDNIP
jgi:hypothetical protein